MIAWALVWLSAATTLPPSILLELRCRSEIAESKITLFDRGAVRWAEKTSQEPVEHVRVRELSESELDAYLARIREIDLREVREAKGVGRGPEGAWLDRCTLILQLPDAPDREYAWHKAETVPLGLSSVIRIVEEMPVGGLDLTGTRLPPGYAPQPGDVLRRRDGIEFRVVLPTSDGQGVELQGIEQPLTVFVPIGALSDEFVELVSTRHHHP